MSPGDAPQKRKVGFFSFKYTRRLTGLLLAAGAAALVARAFAIPSDFGSSGGHFRAGAPAEAAALEARQQGKRVCGRCHGEEFERHERDVHVQVECEDCHGNGKAHVQARMADAPPDQGTIFRELAQANCLACHRRLLARPKLFPSIDVADHFALVGVKDPKTPCQSCHDPHQPLFLERPVALARKHPLIHPCTDCHVDPTVEKRPLPEGHVVTFQCKDCHAAIVADYQKKAHRGLDCRTCHNFHKDSEFSGRIFKNSNPRLCLMCHLDQPFKNDSIPKIESFEAHVADVSLDGGGPDAAPKRCADCHLKKRIHAVPDQPQPAGESRGTPTPPSSP